MLAVWLVACGDRTEHPTQKLVPLEQAWRDYRLGEYRLAQRGFESALAQNPHDPAALYGLGITWQLRRPGEDLRKASEYFERVVTDHPDSDEASWSLLALARILHTPPADRPIDHDAVYLAYQRVIDHNPDHPAADEALMLQQADLLTGSDNPPAQQVADRLNQFVSQRPPNSRFVSTAHTLLTQACRLLGQPDEALKHALASMNAQESLPGMVDDTDRSWTYWNIATLAQYEAGNFDTAREYYQKLIDEYPTDQKVFLAKQNLLTMARVERELSSDARPGGAP